MSISHLEHETANLAVRLEDVERLLARHSKNDDSELEDLRNAVEQLHGVARGLQTSVGLLWQQIEKLKPECFE